MYDNLLRIPVKSSLERLRDQFDLVIITEQYEESLVLLAHLLCVPYRVIWSSFRNFKPLRT